MVKDRRPTSATPPRPKSVQGLPGGLASRCVSPAAERPRPKSGKSLTFHLNNGTDGRDSPTLSCSTRGFGPLNSRMASTPKINGKDLLSVSGPSTTVETTRNGAISPSATPPEVKAMDPAFWDLQMHSTGTSIWTVQSGSLRQVPDTSHGFFHEGNVYLILHVNNSTEKSLHYWIGALACETDIKFVEGKAHDLDKIILTAERFSREIQNYESSVFMSLFPDGVVYIEGKSKMPLSKAAAYDKRMYIVTGRKYPRAACVLPRREYLKPENTLILDGSPRMYVCMGHKTGYIERSRALRLVRKMQKQQKNSKCHIVVIDENDIQLNDAFTAKLEDSTFPMPSKESDGPTGNGVNGQEIEVNQILYRVSGDRVLYDMPEHSRRPLKHCYLVSRDSYLLYRGPHRTLYMWVGHRAMEAEVERALIRAKSFVASKGIPDSVPICRLREDHEPMEFKKCFCDWRERVIPNKKMSLTKRYSVGNIGKALFSQTDRRTIATVKEFWSDDTVGEFSGTSQTWVLTSKGLEPWDHCGIFTNSKCYIVLYTTEDSEQTQQVLYYWMGCKSSVEDRSKIVQLTVEKNASLCYCAAMIRVLDGKEPPHFLAALNDWMIIYDGDEEARETKAVQMFNVRESCDRGIRIQQVRPCWTNLNSSSSFVILTQTICFLWYGKMSGSTEREATKELLRLLCSSRMFSYEIVSEGKEPSSFFDVLGDKQDYQNEYKTMVLERRPPSLVLYNQDHETFQDVESFTQEDLSDTDVVVLDLYDQILLWSGDRICDTVRQDLYSIAQTYIEQDPAGRRFEDISLWLVSQRHETMAFIKHFTVWTSTGYSDNRSYELLRKKLRQDNAKIDINESVVDTSFLGKPKYPYKTLIKKKDLPADVDPTSKQHHLSERQFRENLKLTRADFYQLPLWKQNQILASARLGLRPPVASLSLSLDQD